MRNRPFLIILVALVLLISVNLLRNNNSAKQEPKPSEVKSRNVPADYTITETKEQLIGLQDKDLGVRADLAPWIRSLKMNKDEKFALVNVALADQAIFEVYDDQALSESLGKSQTERVTCLAYKLKNNEKFAKLLSDLRARIFNTQNRVNSYHLYSRKRGSSNYALSKETMDQVCDPYYSGKVPFKK